MTSPRGSNGGGARRSALTVLTDFGSRVLSASAVVAYVAVGAAAILSTSVARAARDARGRSPSRSGSAVLPPARLGAT